jgi:hypothetical protein
MKCLAESGANKPDKVRTITLRYMESYAITQVRTTLVNSLAANIFDTLKANEDISAILVSGLLL